MILISLLIMILGLIGFSISGSFSTLLASRLVTGIGATTLVVLAPLLITIFFKQKNMGIAMGIFNIAVPAGTVIAANLFGILGERIYWRSIILGIGVFVGIVLIINIFALFVPSSEKIKDSDISSKESSGSLLSNGNLWLISLIWMLGNFQLLSYVTFVPQYFQNTGMTIQRAGLLTSFIMFVPIFLSPIIGLIIDKTGWKKRLLLIGSVIMATSFILISRGSSNLLIWSITLGIGFAPIPVIVYSLLPELIRPNQIGMGLGVITIASNIGIAAGPSVFGFLLDNTGGNFNIGFIFLALVSIIIVLALSRIKKNIVQN